MTAASWCNPIIGRDKRPWPACASSPNTRQSLGKRVNTDWDTANSSHRSTIAQQDVRYKANRGRDSPQTARVKHRAVERLQQDPQPRAKSGHDLGRAKVRLPFVCSREKMMKIGRNLQPEANGSTGQSHSPGGSKSYATRSHSQQDDRLP
jgi:hypothetical protein